PVQGDGFIIVVGTLQRLAWYDGHEKLGRAIIKAAVLLSFFGLHEVEIARASGDEGAVIIAPPLAAQTDRYVIRQSVNPIVGDAVAGCAVRAAEARRVILNVIELIRRREFFGDLIGSQPRRLAPPYASADGCGVRG